VGRADGPEEKECGRMKVTVLGTGIMGTGVVHSLLREGHAVTAWNRTVSKA